MCVPLTERTARIRLLHFLCKSDSHDSTVSLCWCACSLHERTQSKIKIERCLLNFRAIFPSSDRFSSHTLRSPTLQCIALLRLMLDQKLRKINRALPNLPPLLCKIENINFRTPTLMSHITSRPASANRSKNCHGSIFCSVTHWEKMDHHFLLA